MELIWHDPSARITVDGEEALVEAAVHRDERGALVVVLEHDDGTVATIRLRPEGASSAGVLESGRTAA